MAKNRGSKPSKPTDNGASSRVPQPKEVELDEVNRLELEKLLLVAENLKTKKQNLLLRRQALDQEAVELEQQLMQNNEARSAFVASHGLDPNKKVDFRDGKLIAVKG